MMDHQEFARGLQIDIATLQVFIDRGWISPLILDERPTFRDFDLARGELIADLVNDMGINDEGVDVVLDLLDQLYSVRFALSSLIDALEVQPLGIRRHVATDSQKVTKLTQQGSRTFR